MTLLNTEDTTEESMLIEQQLFSRKKAPSSFLFSSFLPQFSSVFFVFDLLCTLTFSNTHYTQTEREIQNTPKQEMEADEEMTIYGEEEYEIPEEYHHGEEESEEIQHLHKMFSPHSAIKRQSLNVVVGPSSSQENALTRPPFGEDGDNDEDEDTTYFAEEYHFGDIFAAVKTRHLLATSAPNG